MNELIALQGARVRVVLGLTIILGSLGTLVTIVQMSMLSHVVQQVFLQHQSLSLLLVWLLWLLILILVRSGLTWGREVVTQQAACTVKSKLRRDLFTRLLMLGPAFARGERTGELVTVLNEGIERLDAYFSRYLPQLAFSVLTPLMIGVAIWIYDWLSALLLLVTVPIIPLLMILVGSYAERHIQRQWLALTRMSAHFLDAIQGLPTLRLFGREQAEQERIGRINRRFHDATMKVFKMAFLSGMILEGMTAFAIGLVAVVLGVRLLNGGISFEQAFFILLLTPEFYRPLRELGVQRHAAMEGKAAAKRIHEIFQQPLPVSTTATTSHPQTSDLTIAFEQVSYSYPDSTKAALSAIDLELPAGTCTALVGRSGAGKSTLAQLLMRFVEAQEGQILVNGIPITAFPVELWRDQVAYVPQRPHLFYGSVLDNIRMARPQASMQEVQQAAALAGADSFIEQLPQGYDTLIGERGARLSAGQVQRIAIARALLKDAPLLILDEPTSSLDSTSESIIRQAMISLRQDRTVLVIAHRLNTIVQADQVVVLDEGKVVEQGTHTELLQQNGLYAQLLGVHTPQEVSA